MNEAQRKDAVSSLISLYTVVIGVALSLAVVGVVERDGGLQSITWHSGLLFIAFIATLFPLYHGALRHLFDAYVAPTSQSKNGALVIEFLLLFVHALAFVVLSLLMEKPGHFAWVLIALLTIDILWATFAHFTSGDRPQGFSAPGRWALINVLFVGLTAGFLLEKDVYLQDLAEPVKVAFPIAFAAIVRTVIDYVWCRNFYFPK